MRLMRFNCCFSFNSRWCWWWFFRYLRLSVAFFFLSGSQWMCQIARILHWNSLSDRAMLLSLIITWEKNDDQAICFQERCIIFYSVYNTIELHFIEKNLCWLHSLPSNSSKKNKNNKMRRNEAKRKPCRNVFTVISYGV